VLYVACWRGVGLPRSGYPASHPPVRLAKGAADMVIASRWTSARDIALRTCDGLAKRAVHAMHGMHVAVARGHALCNCGT